MHKRAPAVRKVTFFSFESLTREVAQAHKNLFLTRFSLTSP